MANSPKAAAQKRAYPTAPRQNAQTDHEGSPHRPEEFDSVNPSLAQNDATPTPEEQRVAPDAVRRHAEAQGTAKPAIPGGRTPDTAMCEDRDHPGRIDKTNDC